MKKLLLLGGSAQQVVAIETAKRLGLYTVLCDYLPDNPGQCAADRFYLVSTTDKEAVLQVAKDERVDGVLAYASDPAAPTAAWVAEKLGLPTNPYESVETLCSKDKFREFLAEHGFHTPAARGYADAAAALRDIEGGVFGFPVIVKPVDSSGSKGVTVLQSSEDAGQAIGFALSFSRAKRFVVEEYIEKKHPYLIGGDIFVIDGKVALWGLMNCHRDGRVNPLVPVGKSYPALLDERELCQAKDTLQRLVDCLHICSGAMNVELVIDRRGGVYLIDVGPRGGGNMIPELMGYIFGVDVVEMTIQAAMGQTPALPQTEPACCYATHNLHSDRAGRFRQVCFSPQIEPYIIRKCIYKKPGDSIEYFDNAAKAVGIVFMKFDDQETMIRCLEQSNAHFSIILD